MKHINDSFNFDALELFDFMLDMFEKSIKEIENKNEKKEKIESKKIGEKKSTKINTINDSNVSQKELKKDNLNTAKYVPNTDYDIKFKNMKEITIINENDLIVCLNDIHYGAYVNNAWNKYSSDITKKMLDKYAEKIKEIAKTHNAKDCYVFGLGDYISGFIYDSIAETNERDIIQQVVGISELISNFIINISSSFNHVLFVSVSGNHSMIKERTRSLNDERLDNMIPSYICEKTKKYNNITTLDFDEILDPTMFTVNIRGKKYVGTHGDFEPSIKEICNLKSMFKDDVYAIFCGHKHHSYYEDIQGTKVIMSGSMMSSDEYAISKRLVSNPEQTVCVCNKDGILCIYNIDLNVGNFSKI